MKVLITESKDFSAKAIKRMKRAGWQVVKGRCDHQKLQKSINQYDGIIVRLGIKVDKRIINATKRTKFIATPTTGIDHIDVKTAKLRGIKVISLQGENNFLKTITPTAELAVGLMLNLIRNIIPASQEVLVGKWERERWVGRSMKGRTVGIIGMGRLGTITARLVTALGAKVIYHDPHKHYGRYTKVRSLATLAKAADIVSVHVPLNTETTGLIGQDYFNRAKSGQILINTSRGAVVRERDLIVALRRKRIGGAGLDVITDEMSGQIQNNQIIRYARHHDNVIITPHIGGATYDEMRRVEEFITEKLIEELARGK